jgi:hypothetical protein
MVDTALGENHIALINQGYTGKLYKIGRRYVLKRLYIPERLIWRVSENIARIY